MTIIITGPDGKPLSFASEAECDAYRRALCENEPPSVQCLSRCKTEIIGLRQFALNAATKSASRGDALMPARRLSLSR
jgi:hypothetical protein